MYLYMYVFCYTHNEHLFFFLIVYYKCQLFFQRLVFKKNYTNSCFAYNSKKQTFKMLLALIHAINNTEEKLVSFRCILSLFLKVKTFF